MGDVLTYKILTDSTQMIVYRSVVWSRRDKEGIYKRVPHNPYLDPDVKFDPDNQNTPSSHPLVTSDAPIPTKRIRERIYKPQSWYTTYCTQDYCDPTYNTCYHQHNSANYSSA